MRNNACCVCVRESLTGGEEMWLDTQLPSCLPPQLLHLFSFFELLHLLQRRAVVLHPLHIFTAPFKEAQELVVHQVTVLHI